MNLKDGVDSNTLPFIYVNNFINENIPNHQVKQQDQQTIILGSTKPWNWYNWATR